MEVRHKKAGAVESRTLTRGPAPDHLDGYRVKQLCLQPPLEFPGAPALRYRDLRYQDWPPIDRTVIVCRIVSLNSNPRNSIIIHFAPCNLRTIRVRAMYSLCSLCSFAAQFGEIRAERSSL
jgi:hypothetical protein